MKKKRRMDIGREVRERKIYRESITDKEAEGTK